MFFKISLKVHKIQRRKKFIHGIQQINTIPCEKQYFMKCSEVLDDYQNAPLQKQYIIKRSETSSKTTSEAKSC
jgi:hypothetical protein